MRLSSFFGNMKLRNKLILSYMAALLLPALVIGYFSANKSQSIILDQASQINEISFNQMKNNISSRLGSYLEISTSILYDRTIINDLNTNYKNNINYLDKYLYGFAPYQKLVRVFNPDNFSISIYTTNRTIIQDRAFINTVTDEVAVQHWYLEAVKATGRYITEKPYQKIQGNNQLGGELYFSICRLLSGPPVTRYTNVLKVEVPEAELYKLIEQEGGNKDVYLLDGTGCVITSTQRQTVGGNQDAVPLLDEVVSRYERSGNGRIETQGGIAFCSRIDGTGAFENWIVVTMVSSALLLKDIEVIAQYIIFICIISVAFALAFIILFSRKVTSRLTALVNNMSHIRDGQFEVFVNFPEKDEFGELSRNFSSMIERINNLIHEVYHTEMRVKDIELQKKQAEINALQSQINPHFLFNTMESIRMNVLKNGDPESSDIIQRFSALLRKSIDWGKDLVTLSQEINLVESYLIIQKFRYKKKLTYRIDVETGILQCHIPKFSIQPLVENAIYHGIERKEGSGFLLVSAVREKDRVLIIVQDDGVGMTQELLDDVREWMETGIPNISSRVGIINVYQRLKLNYGSECHLEIASREDEGTTVKIWIPINENEMEAADV